MWVAELNNAELLDAQLNNADLGFAQLNNAFLGEAELKGAYLFEAELKFSDLRGANFCYSALVYPRLYGVQNYKEAKFCKTTLILLPDWGKPSEDFIKKLKLSRREESRLRKRLKEFNLQDAKKFFEQFSDINLWFDSIKSEALRDKITAEFTIKALTGAFFAGKNQINI